MFNFFKKQHDDKDDKIEHKNIASISYKIDKNNKILIDMEVESYDDKSMYALFSILDIISDKQCAPETADILAEHLAKDNQDHWIKELDEHLQKNKGAAMIAQMYEEILTSKPCVSPLDILK
jgi:hypothetical protein